MFDQLVNAGLALVFVLVLAWMILTVATGVTLNGLLVGGRRNQASRRRRKYFVNLNASLTIREGT